MSGPKRLQMTVKNNNEEHLRRASSLARVPRLQPTKPYG